MKGTPPPSGSKKVGSREYDEYRLDLHRGPDGKAYVVIHQKMFFADGSPQSRGFIGRSHALASEAGFQGANYWFVADPE